MGANIDQQMESKMECILASIFERFCWILGAKLGGKIDQKSHRKNDAKTKPFGTRLGPSSGCQGGRDVLRPSPTRPDATQRAENPLPGAARAAALRAKIPVVKNNKETVLRVLTRLGPEAQRIFVDRTDAEFMRDAYATNEISLGSDHRTV